MYGKRVAGFRMMSYAFLEDEKTGEEVIVGKLSQADRWGKKMSVEVAGGVDPWIVCGVLLACRPGSGGGQAGYIGAGAGAY